MSDSKERRRTPRVKAEHDMTLTTVPEHQSAEAVPFRAKSVDLNLGGIYCVLASHMPLFTKMQITLNLPVQDDGGMTHLFECLLEGVVVRIEPEDPTEGCDEYQCAMAFVNTDSDVELVLAKYLLQTMAGGPVN